MPSAGSSVFEVFYGTYKDSVIARFEIHFNLQKNFFTRYIFCNAGQTKFIKTKCMLQSIGKGKSHTVRNAAHV